MTIYMVEFTWYKLGSGKKGLVVTMIATYHLKDLGLTDIS